MMMMMMMIIILIITLSNNNNNNYYYYFLPFSLLTFLFNSLCVSVCLGLTTTEPLGHVHQQLHNWSGHLKDRVALTSL
jgi:hypothetical protein